MGASGNIVPGLAHHLPYFGQGIKSKWKSKSFFQFKELSTTLDKIIIKNTLEHKLHIHMNDLCRSIFVKSDILKFFKAFS